MKYHQKGFSVIEVLAVLLICGVLVFVGWRVLSSSRGGGVAKTVQSEVLVPTQVAPEEAISQDTTPEGWVAYEAISHGFTFSYPREWGEVEERISGPGFSDCSSSCGKALGISFTSKPQMALEIIGRTVDYHEGRSASVLNLHQKGYIVEDGVIKAYTYSESVKERGQLPPVQVISGQLMQNANGIEYVLQASDQSENQFIVQDFDTSNVKSALFNLPENESDIYGLSVSIGVTDDRTGIFEQLVDSFIFN